MHALILAPFDESQLERLRDRMDVSYESWLDTRRLTDPDDLAARILSEDISILVVEADFVFEETFQQCPNLRFVGVCRGSTNQIDLEAAAEHGVIVVNTPGRNARAVAEDISILVVEADFVFEETFQQCPNLRFVGVCRGSTNQIDLEAAAEHGVIVVNTPGRNARAVAEHALALILSMARRITWANDYVSSGSWFHPVAGYTDFRGVEVGSRTVGVIGLGAIGRTLAEVCVGLGMNVVVYDPYVTAVPDCVSMADLATLAQNSDFVSVHVPATSETTGLLDAEFFSQMKTSAYLVNCSDYQVADELALFDALRNRSISGAAFDVFETHPVTPDHPLLELDNVILTPHIGGATDETIERHSKMMADDILRFIEGRRPVNLVTPDVWASPND